MNIALVNATHKWGGVKTWTLETALGLKSRGHTCHISGRPGPFIDKAREKGLPVLPVNFGVDFNPWVIRKFMRFFRENSCELVLVNVGKGMRSAGVAARLLGIPVVHRIGLPGDMLNSPKVKWTYKFIRPVLLAPSKYVKKGILGEHFYIPKEKVRVVHIGKIPQTPPARCQKPLQIVSTSQLNSDKGHEDMLACLESVFDRGYDFHYHIVGTGPEEQALRERVRKSVIRKKTSFWGFQKDIHGVLKNMDLFLLGSYSEGLPNALLEGMAHGLIPVARDIPPVQEMWPGDFQKFLFDSPKECTDILVSVLNEPAHKLREMKQSIQNHIYTHFHFKDKIKELETFFQACINKEY